MQEKQPEKNAWIPELFGIVIIGGICVILPRLLSWFRTFFYLRGWNSGIATWKALLFTVIMILMLWIVWETLKFLWTVKIDQKERKLRIVALAIIVTTISICILGVNDTIKKGIQENRSRLKVEEPLIKKVQELATLPVYAAESSEIYHREIAGFSDHLFSSEQLYYAPRGTLFSAPTVEVGGKYIQISEQTAIYTYDKAVIDGLAIEGYVWSDFNNSKHNISLPDVALFNGRNTDGPLVLKGGETIRTENAQIDQYAGTYELSILLSIMERPTSGTACIVDVYGEASETVIQSEKINSSNFDESGTLNYTTTYTINDTPKVLYGITTNEDVVIKVDGISWRRIM